MLFSGLFMVSFFNAQIGNRKDWAIIATILATRMEVTVMNGKSFASFGPKIPVDEKNYVSVRGHFNWWDVQNRKLIIIPELDYLYRINEFKRKKFISNLYTGAGISPNTFAPKFGLVIYNFLSVEAGYNLEFKPYRHFSTEGFRLSFGLNFIY